MKLNELIKNINFSGDVDSRYISGIIHDSRKVKENSLFIVIEGENEDGYKYIAEAIEKGATAIIANGRQVENVDVPVIHVKNTRKIMSRLASNYYGNPSKKMKITGITGTESPDLKKIRRRVYKNHNRFVRQNVMPHAWHLHEQPRFH